jgi:hypothetical protein
MKTTIKTATHAISTPLSGIGLLILAACLWFAPPARAGLTLDLQLQRSFWAGDYYYGCWPNLSTNSIPPNIAYGSYVITSPGYPDNGYSITYQFDATGFNLVTGSSSMETDFNLFSQGLTNGNWSIFVSTNGTTTNVYHFTVTANISSNSIPAVLVTYPADGTMFITNQPNFTWQGPAVWAGTLVVQDNFTDTNGNTFGETSAYLATTATNWPCSIALPDGTNTFYVQYQTNFPSLVFASTPVDNLSHPISSWTSTADLDTYCDFQFIVGSPPPGTNSLSGGHTNVVYYSFEDDNLFARDFSGHGNNISGYGWFSAPPYMTNAAAAGLWAVGYTSSGWQSPPTNLVATLAGSFSVSLWARTSNNPGNDSDTADAGAGLLSANSDQVIPMALTGSKLAFLTGSGTPDTLHSVTSINTGNYVHLVVTRDQGTGEKKVYVNGILDASDFGATGQLNTGSNPTLFLGMNSTFSAGFKGDMDEVQIYSGVLSSNEVMQLYNNPGTVIPDLAGGSNNGLIAHYDFDEGNVVAPDVSGNGNNIVLSGNFGGSGPSISADTAAGAGSVYFDGGSYLTASSNLLATMARDFSVSVWVKTSQIVGSPGDMAYWGAVIVSADIPTGGAGDAIPIALTDGQVAFNTGDGYNDDTLNSYATVNDDTWHHVVVTRNQATGEKQIYIDSALDNSEFGTTVLLNGPQLLTLGAKSDANDPDPSSPDYNGSQGYEGLLDDVQMYSRVLSSDEVAYLYSNPGSTLAGFSYTPYPVDVSLQLTIIRSQDPNWGEIYGAGVSFISVNPAPTTTNSVYSPNNYFYTKQYPYGGEGGGAVLSSLGEVLNEFTNGSWTIYINQGSPTQQVYTFQVSISGLDTSLLQAVKVFSPTNGALNLATNPVYYWTGPSNFSTLEVGLFSGPVAYPPVTATNWPSAPTLNYGPDVFYVDYTSNSFPGVTFTTPVDASSNPVRTWTATVNLSTDEFDNFVVGPNPTQLINAQPAGTNFQFSFLSQTGVTNSVQYRTNLILGNWLTYSNITGDGSLKTIPIPVSVFKGAKTGFIRISSQ